MNLIEQVIAEAEESALQEDIELTEAMMDDETEALTEGLEEAIFHENGEEDFAPSFDDTVDNLQFFNQTYVATDNLELNSMFDPDNTDLQNASHEAHEDLHESEDPNFDFLGHDFESEILDREEVMFGEDEEVEPEVDESEQTLEEMLALSEEEDEAPEEEIAVNEDTEMSLSEMLALSEEDDIDFDDEEDDDEEFTREYAFSDEDEDEEDLEESFFI